jgi:putative transposase
MLASYTRAVNNQEKWSGSLFRKKTKAINLTKIESITPSWYISHGITAMNVEIPERQYPNICFNYILNNPVKDGLVKDRKDWEFSSYQDMVGLRDGKMINRERIAELGMVVF